MSLVLPLQRSDYRDTYNIPAGCRVEEQSSALSPLSRSYSEVQNRRREELPQEALASIAANTYAVSLLHARRDWRADRSMPKERRAQRVILPMA